jgi:hypothetical protein
VPSAVPSITPRAQCGVTIPRLPRRLGSWTARTSALTIISRPALTPLPLVVFKEAPALLPSPVLLLSPPPPPLRSVRLPARSR